MSDSFHMDGDFISTSYKTKKYEFNKNQPKSGILINTPTQRGEYTPQPCSGMNRTPQEMKFNHGCVPHPSLKPVYPVACITQ